MQDPNRLTATELVRRIRAGTLSPVDLMESCLDQIAAREPEVRAFAHFDAEAARRAARSTPMGSCRCSPRE